jgi:hypothetical protein
MDAHTWPSLLYKGEVDGEDFNLNNRQDGLFEGYLVEHMILFYFQLNINANH